MGLFKDWRKDAEEKIGSHTLVVLRSDGKRTAVAAVAKAMPAQYVSSRRYAQILEKLGKKAAAEYLRAKLPTTRTTKSGELAEVLALSFVEERTVWGHTVKKLRWKDHREMPMRGDDVLAIRLDGQGVSILKGEAKSREVMSAGVLREARKALKANQGRPSPHALAFYADRLAEDGREDLADAIDELQYRNGVPRDAVSHMIFSFSGNDPESLLRRRLTRYKGRFEQLYVGVRVKEHRKFVDRVFGKVNEGGDA